MDENQDLKTSWCILIVIKYSIDRVDLISIAIALYIGGADNVMKEVSVKVGADNNLEWLALIVTERSVLTKFHFCTS